MPEYKDIMRVNPENIAKPAGYFHVVSVSSGYRMIFLSGQVGLLPDGSLPGKGFQMQAAQVFKNLDAALGSVGATLRDLVKINVYLTDVGSQLEPYKTIRNTFLDLTNFPTSTIVEVKALADPRLLIEIDAVAAVRDPVEEQ